MPRAIRGPCRYEFSDGFAHVPERVIDLERQPGDLGVLRTNVTEEARTRGFASPALAGFAFIAADILRLRSALSILGCAYVRLGLSTVGRMSALSQ
jgi:hypothetical protein